MDSTKPTALVYRLTLKHGRNKKDLNKHDPHVLEEMKANVNNTTPKKSEIPKHGCSRTPVHAFSPELDSSSKSPLRSPRQSRKRVSNSKENIESSDQEEGERILRNRRETPRRETRKSARKSTPKRNYRDILSEDSTSEYEGPEESWISEVPATEVDPIHKTPIKLNLKRVWSLDPTKSASKLRSEENHAISVIKTPHDSPKLEIQDSDSDSVPHPKVTTRKHVRTAETADQQDAATPKKTPRSKQTPKPTEKETSVDTPEKNNVCASLNTRTGLIPRTPRSGKERMSLRSRLSITSGLESHKAKSVDTDEDSDTVCGRRSTLPSRRSSRISSVEESGDIDWHPHGRREKSPESRTKIKSGRKPRPPAKRLVAEFTLESDDSFGKCTTVVGRPAADAESRASDGEAMTIVGDSTPKKPRTPAVKGKTPKKKSPAKTPRMLKPSMPERSTSIPDMGSGLDQVRANLHVSAVPKSLPCREKEFNDIYYFVGGKIGDSAGGCMYISGMPGTGKTATVHAVVRRLEQDVSDGNLPPFQFIEVNGLRLTEPRQVFVRILQQLTGEKCTPQHAQEILSKKFTSGKGFNKAVLLLVDEVDMLRNRRQDVVYNLFDWPSKARSKLIVLTIANTMDLPERLLMGRVTSRLGLTRLTFQPYNYKQLQEIVTARLQGSECFNPDAVQLVARKVAAVSGDARRALDICRRATELLNDGSECVSLGVVDNALKQMMNCASIKTLRACSRMEQLFLQAVVAETKRTGVEETNFHSVYRQLKSICDFNDIRIPNVSQSLGIVNRLGSSRILLTEHGKADIMQTIFLNVNCDDIHYAMTKPA